MKVLSFTENPDGSATMEVEMSEKEKTHLLNQALNDILRKHLEEIEKQEKNPNN